MWCSNKYFSLVFLVFLSGCGLHPLYGGHTVDAAGVAASDRLQQVKIDPIDDRLGQEFHNRLRDAFNPYGQPGQPLYHLSIALSEIRRATSALINLESTREDLILTATFVLKDIKDKSLLASSAQSQVSYNVFQDPYNDLITRRDAHLRAVNQLTEQVRNRIALFFANNETANDAK
ncbi:MAG TPA: LPS assembly lipoprotein LptE [Dongiaceae bacterium]|jgi:LPS-assembly lipoprotein|nr:LPS assembly lipoprotein LptE [Dongiaceae bacterium]